MKVLVFDNGADTLKAGFAGEEQPRWFVFVSCADELLAKRVFLASCQIALRHFRDNYNS